MSVIESSLSTTFNDVNEKVGAIAAEVGKTPQQWNASVFSIIQTLSENVILPIAGLIITFILCYELITMITEKNNLHDMDTFMFFKFLFKACAAVVIATHTFDITLLRELMSLSLTVNYRTECKKWLLTAPNLLLSVTLDFLPKRLAALTAVILYGHQKVTDNTFCNVQIIMSQKMLISELLSR